MFYYLLFIVIVVITHHRLTNPKVPELLRKLYDYNYINYLLNKPNQDVLKTIPQYYLTKGGFKWCDKTKKYITTPQRLNLRWYRHNS